MNKDEIKEQRRESVEYVAERIANFWLSKLDAYESSLLEKIEKIEIG